jgi:hypothetical protein
MHWRRGRLDDIAILAANAGVELNKEIVIWKKDNIPLAQCHAKILCYLI